MSEPATPQRSNKNSPGESNAQETGQTGKNTPDDASSPPAKAGDKAPKAKEVGGREGPEPTRFGDWEVKGICVDF